MRLFLIKTSIVDEFSVRLCEQLTQNSDAGKILNMLCSENMFISRQNDIYRYHHVFLDFLRLEAGKLITPGDDAIYKMAADHYLEEGNYFDALRFYVKTDDRKGTSTALYYFWNSTGKSSSELSRISFINELPNDFLDRNPYLYISCAWYALFFSNAKSFFFHLDKLYERIGDIIGEYKMFIESMLFLFTIDHRYTFTQQMARLPAGDAIKADDRSVPKSQCQYFPFFHRTHRDYSHYAKDTEEHFAEFHLAFFSMLGCYYPIIESGVRAGILYEKNQLKEAFSLVMSNPATDSDELIFLSKLQIAACLFAMGKTEESVRQREEIRSFLENKNLLYLLPVFTAFETKIKLLNGDKSAAKVWLDNYFVHDRHEMELHKIYLHFTTARAYIVLGQYKKAQLLCEELKALSRDFGRLLDEIEANVLLIILKWIAGKKQEAVSLLQTTLACAEPFHFIRVFADEGQAILPIIKMLGKKISINNQSTLNYKYVHEIQQAAYAQSKRQRGVIYSVDKPIKLSKQQKYVLELLAKGYKNAEIVEITGLSINTIRSHTKIAYQKLGVSTAMDAVLCARKLELID